LNSEIKKLGNIYSDKRVRRSDFQFLYILLSRFRKKLKNFVVSLIIWKELQNYNLGYTAGEQTVALVWAAHFHTQIKASP
jgi:hypothetical protein